MEVLSRLLNAAASLPGFRFHPKCSKLFINHLCFADDLMLFAHGDVISANIFKAILVYFERISGLSVNNEKSSIIFSSIDENSKAAFLDVMAFQEGFLPLTYLGVPLVSTKLSSAHCHQLVERISFRISSWTSKFLSFAGRLQLVKSVLYSIHSYWCGMFILPKKILKSIEQKCAMFLWSGSEMKKHSSKVKWDDISLPFSEGGLGIRKCSEWNLALSARHLWDIITRAGSLWVAWIQAYRLGTKSVWQVKVPRDCSWAWRKLLSIRDTLKPLVSYSIGNGTQTFMWYDPWLPQGAIVDIWGDRVIYDAASSPTAKVSDFIDGEVWNWPTSITTDLLEIREPASCMPRPNREDKALWKLSSNNLYSTSSLWEHIRIKKNQVPWYKVVWFTGYVPKHGFTLWLAILDRLPTLSRLLSWGVVNEAKCVLCNVGIEDRDHLFFNCSFASSLWSRVLQINGSSFQLGDWNMELNKLMLKNPKKIGDKLYCLSFATTVHQLWRERNARIHGENSSTIMGCLHSISWIVRHRFDLRGNEKLSNYDSNICNRWGINLDNNVGLSSGYHS